MPTVEINPVHTAPVETPSGAIIKAAAKTATVRDGAGRSIVIRRLMPSMRQRLFAIAGPELSKNEMWLGTAALTFAVVSIDGDPVTPNNIRELEVLGDQLDEHGLEAVGECYVKSFGKMTDGGSLDTVKN